MSYFQERIAQIRAELGIEPPVPKGRKGRKPKKASERVQLSKKAAASPPAQAGEGVTPEVLPRFEELADQLRLEDQELEER
jgi:hypothetical protein